MAGARLLSSRPPPPRAPEDIPGNEAPPLGRPHPDVPAPRRSRFELRPLDALLPVAVALWLAAVRAIDPTAMNDFGLLPALPVAYFVALALVAGSAAVALARAELSPVRLALHLVVLVLFLHGTVPLVFREPIFPWVYKHVGVVGYLNVHGALDPRVDIYQNWPGFFALAAWLTRIAGVGSPLTYAAWAPVYFNLLVCVELAFVFRWLPVTRRVRWLAMFVFVAANWVGQDYFAPQATAFVLSLAVFGVVLTWLQVDRPPAPVRVVRRLASRLASIRLKEVRGTPEPEGAPRPPDVSRAVALGVLFFTFTVIVVTHQLTPYVIVLSVGLLTIAGLVRPRWVVVGLAAIAVGYLLLHFSYVERTQDLFGSVGDPLGNAKGGPDDSVPMRGRRLTTLAAPALMVGLWTLASIGLFRRLRRRRPVLLLALLSGAPVLILLGQSYGGEAVFRIYLFSLPWIALLGASALEPRGERWRWPLGMVVGAVLAVEVALFLSAFYGSLELYEVRPGEVEASRYFYANAEPGSVLTLAAPNFPTRVGERYDQFAATGDNPPNLLTTVDHFRHRMLGPDDLPAVAEFAGEYVGESPGGRYLALSKGQQVYANVLGLLPRGSLARLDEALAQSPSWRVYYRNADAVIYRLLRSPLEEQVPRPPPPPPPSDRQPRSVEWAGVGVALLGTALIPLAVRRRRSLAAAHVMVAPEQEEAMSRARHEHVPSGAEERGPEPEPLAPAASARVEELLRHAAAAGGDARQQLLIALRNLDPEPARIRDLVAGVESGSRPEAIRLLGGAWGPLPSAPLRPLLGDLSAPVRAAAVEVLDHGAEPAVLRQLLADDLSADVRLTAIRALAHAPERDQLSALSLAVADPDSRVRASAIELLEVAGTTRAASQLLAANEDPHEDVRRAAQRRLVAAHPWLLWMALHQSPRRPEFFALLREEMSEDALVALVQERASSPEAGDRVLAVQLAGWLGSPECVAEAVEALHDPDATVRRAAAGQLRGRPEAADALIATLHDDPDPAVRVEAATALDGMDLDNALLAFVGALQDPDAKVQRIAVQALVRNRSSALAHRVAAALTTTNVRTVGEVLLGMGHFGDEALAAAVAEGPRDRAVAAVELLRTRGRPAGLLESVGALDPATRLRAVEALGAVGGSDAAEALMRALSDSWPAIRSRAAFHLGQMGAVGGREALQRVAESDPDPEVVRSAMQALRVIDERAREAGAPAATPLFTD